MLVVGTCEGGCAEHIAVRGHGPAKGHHWFEASRARCLSPEEARTALRREREQAGARGVACNSPDCWCAEAMNAGEVKL